MCLCRVCCHLYVYVMFVGLCVMLWIVVVCVGVACVCACVYVCVFVFKSVCDGAWFVFCYICLLCAFVCVSLVFDVVVGLFVVV